MSTTRSNGLLAGLLILPYTVDGSFWSFGVSPLTNVTLTAWSHRMQFPIANRNLPRTAGSVRVRDAVALPVCVLDLRISGGKSAVAAARLTAVTRTPARRCPPQSYRTTSPKILAPVSPLCDRNRSLLFADLRIDRIIRLLVPKPPNSSSISHHIIGTPCTASRHRDSVLGEGMACLAPHCHEDHALAPVTRPWLCGRERATPRSYDAAVD